MVIQIWNSRILNRKLPCQVINSRTSFLSPLLRRGYSVYTSLGLKGQNNSAQGKRSVALGRGCRRKTVREDSMNKAKNPFRTELQDTIFGKHKVISIVRNKIFSLMNVIERTFLMSVFKPRATLLRRLLWARICWPFRPLLLSKLITISDIKRCV